MERYKNLSAKSGVIAYKIARGSIDVVFVDGAVYRYTEASAGRRNIRRMKELAEAGMGLSTFIAQQVQEAYAERLR